MDPRKILIALAMKYDGDWLSIYDHVANKMLMDDKEVEQLNSKCKYQTITILDSNYPQYLKTIYRPPFVLFYEGDISLLKENTTYLGVVGSREPEALYAATTNSIIKSLNKKIVIVSGLAKGIDGIAHKAALESGKKTIAVIGCGLNVVYPMENLTLYKDIRKKGLIVTEYPQDSPPDKDHFPHRNRIIAAIAYRLFVPHARERSGSIITVGYALEAGKDVLCLPSSDFGNSACNLLIKDGACLVESAQDIDDFYASFLY